MNFNTFSDSELIALIGLVKQILAADDVVSHAEKNKLQLIIVYIGEEKYRDIMDEYNKHFKNPDKFRKLLGSVKDQRIRESIYGAAFEIAISESIDTKESEILDWLADQWEIDVKFE